MRFTSQHPADQLVAIMTRIYRCGMTTVSGGNLSILDTEGDIWITPSGIDKGALTRDDIMQVKPDGTVIGRHRPSIELPFHREIYRRRSDIRATVHAHPPTLIAYSLARVNPNVRLIPEDYARCGSVSMAKYAVPGSELLGGYIADEFSKGYSTVMLENHGVVLGGKDLLTTFCQFETIDFCGRMGMLAARLGKARELCEAEIARYTQTCEMETLPAHEMTSEERAARRDLAHMTHRCYQQKLFTSTQGVWSLKLSDGGFLITPDDIDRMELTETDLIYIRDGKCEAGKQPPHNAYVHAAIYQRHAGISSVIEAHPPAISAFTVTDASFDSRTIPESYLVLRDVRRLPFSTGLDNAEEIAEVFNQKTSVALIENRGCIVTGAGLANAFDKLEVLEYSAQAIIAAKDVGPIVLIQPEEISKIEEAFHMND
ncbi:MAG: class II aldolase/adducin family protein [Clostridia bacterium]|nr:class II aldolase/adducin family protein [Clostridia bacterium]